jgi:putative Mg2+ transporter-C (MgtC) family protein
MASAALTTFAGYPGHWYGGGLLVVGPVDPTRLVQGIVTGVGFLGAGVIMREGPNIRGLTTAASIWASSAIGVLVGVGFYAAAMLLTLLSTALMMYGRRVEEQLPCRPAIAVVLTFAPGFTPSRERVAELAHARGYDFVNESLSISHAGGQATWKFAAVAEDRHRAAPIADVAGELSHFEGLAQFQLTPSRS